MNYLQKVWIFDNKGNTLDRYTIITKASYKLGNQGRFHFIWGASNNPYHPQGFGQFCGEIEHWKIKDFIKEWRTDETHSEIRGIAKKQLSDEVKSYIKYITTNGK